MPEPVLGPWDTAVSKTDRNSCPQGAYSPTVGFNLPWTMHCINSCLCSFPLPSPHSTVLRSRGCAFFTPWSLHSIQCYSLSIYRMTNKIIKMPSFPQPAFFKFSPISFWQGVYDPSFICGPAPAPHLTLFSFFSKIHSHVASWDMKKK